MKYLVCLLLALVLPVVAAFAGAPAPEMGMLVTGTITVKPDGAVAAYVLHDQDKLPAPVVAVVDKTVSNWRFQPVTVDGKAVLAQAGMVLRVVADKVDNDHVAIKVAGANFGCAARQAATLLPGACDPAGSLAVAQRQAPRYPMGALKARASGTVYLVLEVGRDGRVARVAARQIDLRSLEDPTPTRQAHYRTMLADASIVAARDWRFKVPTTGPETAKDHWVIQIPVVYSFCDPADAKCRAPKYGEWDIYVPGPVQTVPWAGADHPASADAVPGDTPFVRDARFVLTTPLATGGGQG